MNNTSPQMIAAAHLRRLIQLHYKTQEQFANDFGIEIRTLSRYLNNGINKIDVIQELALFFDVSFTDFFSE